MSNTNLIGRQYQTYLGIREIGNPEWLCNAEKLRSLIANGGARRYWQRDADRIAALEIGQSCQVNTGLHPKHGETETTVTRIK